MGILLIESSSKKIEFGFVDTGSDEFLIKESLVSNHNADTLTYFIKKSFDENIIDFKEIEYVSLSNGPGSFTGLRIGSAISKGICFALKSKLIEIPTLDIVAEKYRSEFTGVDENSEKEIVSLIFSDTKGLEFYFGRYRPESGNIKRISDYKTDLIENIMKEDCYFVINEKVNDSFKTEFRVKLTDVSDVSNLDSQYKIAKNYMLKNNFSNYNNSEPYYMKEFVPKTN